MSWFLDSIFGRRIRQETHARLNQLWTEHEQASRRNAIELLARLRRAPGPVITLGTTEWDEQVRLPLSETASGHSLVTGATGSGKTSFCLGIFEEMLRWDLTAGSGVVDVRKDDMTNGMDYRIAKRILELQNEPNSADRLRTRVVKIDFSCRNPVSSYNIFSPWPNVDADFFASSRADLLLELLPGGESPSLTGRALLQRMILLLSRCGLPIERFSEVLYDGNLRCRLVSACGNATVQEYFARQFAEVPKATIAALSRRIEALFISESVRLAISGPTAPDFAALQDESNIIQITCFGAEISPSVRELLQALVFSDIHQSIFRRREKDRPFLWFFDEAQNLLRRPRLREMVDDFVRLGRSFGTYGCFITQDLAVGS